MSHPAGCRVHTERSQLCESQAEGTYHTEDPRDVLEHTPTASSPLQGIQRLRCGRALIKLFAGLCMIVPIFHVIIDICQETCHPWAFIK